MAFTMPDFSSLGNWKQVKLKSLVWPFLWSILFISFLFNVLHTTPSTSSSASKEDANTTSSSLVSHPGSLTHNVGDYYDGLAHSAANTTDMDHGFITANISTSNKVAVIIETRKYNTIIPLILHFATVLGPSWPIVIFTNSENFGTFTTSHALLRYQQAGRVHIRPLEEGTYFPSWNSVSWFMTKKWIWQALAPAEHILVFQSDAILCSNSPRSVEDFFEYDLIGAPIAPQWGRGYNGGLSLRSRKTTLRVLDEWEWKNGGPEDQWYFNKFEALAKRDKEEGRADGVNLPSYEIARTFAVETIDYPSPLGLHQPTRFIDGVNRYQSLDEWCPEYKLATTDRINT